MIPVIWTILILTDLSSGKQPAAQDISKGVDWLTRYGYLPRPDPLTSQLQTLESLTDAIRSMQRFAGIQETGILDQKTLDMMKRPRCSLPDIIGTSEIMRRRRRRRRRRYALAGNAWKKTALTWRIKKYPEQSNLEQNTITLLLHHAFQVWSKVSPLEFHQRPNEDVDILIEFGKSQHGDGYPFDGAGGTLAHAFFPGDHPISGDAHFDEDETWTYNSDVGTDLFAVAIHEFGHAIGLAHSSAGQSIMQPYYQGPAGEVRQYQLPQDDVYGIEQLYGRRQHPNEEKPEDPALHPSIPEVPIPHPSSKPGHESPDRCTVTFDAVANIRGESFFFKDHYFWRMQRAGNLVSLSAAQIKNFWRGLPLDLKKVDSVYERITDHKIVFFIGAQYWVFTNTDVEPGYPRSIRDFELPVDSVDAAFVWAHNGKTYFFRGDDFWRFDEQRKKMDVGYPKKVSLWKGVPPHLDDIMGFDNGTTYFFKGLTYWRMRAGEIEVEFKGSTPHDWMHCDVPAEPPGPEGPKAGECSCMQAGNTGRVLSPGGAHLVIVLLAHLCRRHFLLD
ncbi:matrix metalloproteinase-17-like [Pristis pectinata]|uniref:matrix metalloproteinase-17-like n=1 Tax=Pristis pectinata TaxID=685728 RepID=UPI00223E58E2|nr:matrix metalloproteinase-17-like [Pristis pectinata]